MADSDVRIQLDTVRKNNLKLIYAAQNDYGARYITAELLTDGKKNAVASAAAVSINAKRPDGEKSAFSGTVNADGTVTVPVTQWMLAYEGEVVCSISAVETDKRLTTTHFYLQAQESIWDGTSVPSADDSNKDVILEIIASENVRISNENARISAENARAAAETARINAERPRIANEAIRVANEAERVSAEDVRKTEFAAWQGEIGKISAFDKRIENLEAAVTPGLVTPTADDSVAYVKDVPDGALPFAAVSEIGGMTYNDDGILRDAKVTVVESVGVNLFDQQKFFTETCGVSENVDGTFTIPASVLSGKSYKILWKPNTQYTLSLEVTNEDTSKATYAIFAYDDGTDDSYGPNCFYTVGSFSWTSKPNKTVSNLYFVYSDNNIYTLKDVILNEGNTALPYAPYFKRTFPIPEAVQALDGYGQGINKDYHNKIVLDPVEGMKKFVKIVETKIFDGTEYFTLWTDSVGVSYGVLYDGLKYDNSAGTEVRGVCNKYTVYPSTPPSGETGIGFRQIGDGYYRWYINVEEAGSVDSWKAYLAEQYANGTPLTVCYVVETPVETDISDYFGDDNMIGVESGGTITAVNEYEYDVPSVIEYTVKGSDAT